MRAGVLKAGRLLVLAAGLGAAQIAAAAPQADETIRIAGLRQPAQILVDSWGVPHIYAQNRDDVFFVQGFNAARDRLFQIDLWRRRGLGQLAAVFGPAYVEQDRAARLFLYRGDMAAEWRAYGAQAQAISARFAAGINAYIDYLAQQPKRLPFEFRLLRYRPAKWTAQDVVRIRSHGLTRNLVGEVARAKIVCQSGLAADQIRAGLSPEWVTRVPDGLDPCLPDQVLRDFTLATQNPVFGASLLNTVLAEASPQAEEAAAEEAREGSNNWVVAPSRSASGRAILANDPHRAYSAPSLRYLAHLSAPGLDVIGAGEPALPGISIGHNGTIAFGLTIFSIDQEDLYAYQTDPDDALRYRYRDGWEKFRSVRETIAVRGHAPVQVELLFSRHGPVIYREPGRQRAFAVRTAWMAPGMAPYFGSIEYMQAKDFAQFRQAMSRWGAPTENQVYADASGNIGWVAGGLAPQRPNWDGLLPVPGDGRYEWAGFLPGAQLPFALNPVQGWLASANELNLPPGYPYRNYKLGFEWPHDARAVRIGEVLSGSAPLTLDAMQRLQNDVVSLPARRLIAVLKTLNSDAPDTRAALALLSGWDAVETVDSNAAALFEVWWSRHLTKAYKLAVLDAGTAALIAQPDVAVMLEALENPVGRFGADAESKRNRVLLESLTDAWADLCKLQGSDARAWRWGKLQFSYFVHPLAGLLDPGSRAAVNVGPFPRGGSAYTVNQSSYQPGNFAQTNGPSVRLVIDVGAWDNSRAINTPGQSGDPTNPHYRDLAPAWASGEYFPLLYSRKAVEAASGQRIVLLPGAIR